MQQKSSQISQDFVPNFTPQMLQLPMIPSRESPTCSSTPPNMDIYNQLTPCCDFTRLSSEIWLRQQYLCPESPPKNRLFLEGVCDHAEMVCICGPQIHTFHKAWLEDRWAFGSVMPCFEGITLHIKHLENFLSVYGGHLVCVNISHGNEKGSCTHL